MATTTAPAVPSAGLRRPTRLHRATRVLQALLLSALTISVVHYADNTIRWDDYTRGQEGGPIARWMVPAGLVLFTALGVVGYRAWRRRRWSLAAAALGACSVSGLISPAHFTDVSPSDYSAFQLTSIALDTLAGVGILAFAVWLALAGSPDGQPAPEPAAPA